MNEHCNRRVALFLPTLSVAQGTDLDTIRGTVTDASGGVVLKATVQITDSSTGSVCSRLPYPNLSEMIPNPEFGRVIKTYAQENIDSRHAIRLRLRIEF
jgi:hypothetical protein